MAKTTKRAKSAKEKKPSDGYEFIQDTRFAPLAPGYPSPIVFEANGELRVAGCATNYWLYGKSKNSDYREAILRAPAFRAVTYFANPEKGMKELKAKTVEDWEDISDKRFEKAMRLRFEQHSGLRTLLLSWNPKNDPLEDKYAREGEPDVIKVLRRLRTEFKEAA